MHITQLQESNTILTYSLMTTPSPVQVSPSATKSSVATLTFVVSCPHATHSANVAKIEISIPVDTADQPDPTNLAATKPPKSSASISSTGSDEWEISMGQGDGNFIFTPKGGHPVQVSDQSLTIAFTGIEINTVVGTALVHVSEWAAHGDGPPPFEPSVAAIMVPKFPYGFFAGNFATNEPMIQRDQGATLSWVGTDNATYTMLWATQTQDVSSVRTWTSPALTDTTTFILQVTAQESGQTVTLYFSLTVIVATPSVTNHDLTVLTTSALNGAVTVGQPGATAPLTLNGDLSATGNASVSGDATVNRNLTARGNITGNGTLALPGGWVFAVDASGDLKLTHDGELKLQVSRDGAVSLPGEVLNFGPWTLKQTRDANTLIFTVGDKLGLAFDADGNFDAGGILTSNSVRAILQGPNFIRLPSRNALLNATDSIHGGTDSRGGAYWKLLTDPDKDSDLEFNPGNPFKQKNLRSE